MSGLLSYSKSKSKKLIDDTGKNIILDSPETSARNLHFAQSDIEAAIERNNQQAIAELKKYGIKISKNEIAEYIELATNQKHTEIVALLLDY